jgi:predicted PurR-regulated permease PerM
MVQKRPQSSPSKPINPDNHEVTPMQSTKHPYCTIAAYIFSAVFLLMVLVKGLLAALFSGLLVYSLIHLLTPLLGKKISNERARIVAAAALGCFVVVLLSLAIWGLVVFFRSDAGNMQNLFHRLAGIIDASRDKFPVWLEQKMPADADGLREMSVGWLHENAVEAQLIGAEAGHAIVEIGVGMVIGIMVVLREAAPPSRHRPLTAALLDRVTRLHDAFRNIVFAQVWISAINTVIVAVFILLILPMLGIKLPLAKSLIAITFVAGMLPVIGNLISNSILVIVGLSHSLQTAFGALLFMVVVHKVEYFLNARIIGAKINASAWELLLIMLVMESIFGLSGVIAAPVFYAYVKKELTAAALI